MWVRGCVCVSVCVFLCSLCCVGVLFVCCCVCVNVSVGCFWFARWFVSLLVCWCVRLVGLASGRFVVVLWTL